MRQFAVFCVISILLNACSLQPVQTEPSVTVAKPPLGEPEKQVLLERRQSLALLKQWIVFGRMSIQTPDDAWTGKLEWRQYPLNYQILFSAPTGQGTIKIRGDDAHVVLETSKGQSFISDDEESLLYDQLGWELPIDKLRQWMLGLSALNQLSKITLDETGNIRQLNYPGWEVNYFGFQSVDTYMLPKKLFITGPKLKFRIIIDNWVLST